MPVESGTPTSGQCNNLELSAGVVELRDVIPQVRSTHVRNPVTYVMPPETGA
jgi:hypothetical protein